MIRTFNNVGGDCLSVSTDDEADVWETSKGLTGTYLQHWWGMFASCRPPIKWTDREPGAPLPLALGESGRMGLGDSGMEFIAI